MTTEDSTVVVLVSHEDEPALSRAVQEKKFGEVFDPRDYTEIQFGVLLDNFFTCLEETLAPKLPRGCYWRSGSIVGPLGTDVSDIDFEDILDKELDHVLDNRPEFEWNALYWADQYAGITDGERQEMESRLSDNKSGLTQRQVVELVLLSRKLAEQYPADTERQDDELHAAYLRILSTPA
jgi:hypothetical protein